VPSLANRPIADTFGLVVQLPGDPAGTTPAGLETGAGVALPVKFSAAGTFVDLATGQSLFVRGPGGSAAFSVSAAGLLSGDGSGLTGLAALDGTGKILASQLPDLAVIDYLGASADQTAMLALTGQKGDWTTRSDTGTAWIITGNTPSSLSSWTQLPYPSVTAGTLTGTTLASNVVASSLTSVGTLTSLAVAGAATLGGNVTVGVEATNSQLRVHSQNSSYGQGGIRLTNAGQDVVLQCTTLGNFYVTTPDGTAAGMTVGTLVNPTDASMFVAAYGLWTLNSNLAVTGNATVGGSQAVGVTPLTIKTVASQSAPALKVLASDGTTTVASIGADGTLAITTGPSGGLTTVAGVVLVNLDSINNYVCRNTSGSGNAYYGVALGGGSTYFQAASAPESVAGTIDNLGNWTLNGTLTARGSQTFLGVTSTAAVQNQAAITASWADSTDATRRGTLSLGAYYIGTWQTGLTLTANATTGACDAAFVGNVTVGTLTGGATGVGFTLALSASTVTGTLADVRLSANVPLLNAANTFTGVQTYTGGVDSRPAGATTYWGYRAGLGAAPSVSVSAIGTTAVGQTAAGNLTTGTNNTIVGFQTGGGLTTGSNNTVLGSQVNLPAAGTGLTLIGRSLVATGATQIVMLGYASTVAHNYAVSLGTFADTVKDGQMVTGRSISAWTFNHLSTTTTRPCAEIQRDWADSTDATRRGILSLGAYYLGTLQTGLTLTANASTLKSDALFGGTLSVPGAGLYSERFGALARAGLYSTAVGYDANAVGTPSGSYGSTAIGAAAVATGFGATAVGFNTPATGDHSVAIGYQSGASGANSVAIGNAVTATQNSTVILGTGSDASCPAGSLIYATYSPAPQIVLAQFTLTVPARPQASIKAAWTAGDFNTTDDATRTGRLILSAYSVASVQEGVRVEGDPAGVKLAFYGGTAVAKAASPGTAAGTDAAVINAISTVLRNLNLCA
jgi:hypothetical protein